ncbi:MAG: serine hydrolase [Proteobacteria bacterium]|nr:serine hydrolase [Pseudomonadota bacterium]
MRGFPVPPDGRVPRQDWDRAPWNRWSFQHVREILPTAEVWRGDGPVWRLPAETRDMHALAFTADGGVESTIGQWLADDFTDGFIVLHRGTIVFERYMNGMTERTLHLSQSVAKSFTATVAGILVGRGLMDPDSPVTEYLPELKRTAWKGAKLRHVLDMTSGVRFVEDYEAPDSDIALTDIASGWKPKRGRGRAPACIWDQIMGLKVQDREHGEIFRYKSIETDVLAHCMERVTGTRLADLVSRELWAPLGAQESACFTVDSAGYALADGGFNATLRDYARFGLMHQNSGVGNGRRILPAEWIEDTWRGDHSIFGAPYTGALPNGAYRNKFWIPEHGKRAYTARGVFGQFVHVDPDSALVAVKLSSWPEFQSIPRTRTFMNAVGAIVLCIR